MVYSEVVLICLRVQQFRWIVLQFFEHRLQLDQLSIQHCQSFVYSFYFLVVFAFDELFNYFQCLARLFNFQIVQLNMFDDLKCSTFESTFSICWPTWSIKLSSEWRGSWFSIQSSRVVGSGGDSAAGSDSEEPLWLVTRREFGILI